MKSIKLLSFIGLTGIIILTALFSFGQTVQYEKFSYISPVPGSKFINPENNIAFRYGDVLDLSSVRNSMITVKGFQTGKITGTLKLSKDSKTLIFLPDQPYNYNETIMVNIEPGLKTESGKVMEGVSFSFTTKQLDNLPLLHNYYQKEYEDEMEEISSFTNSISEVSIQKTNQIIHGDKSNREGLPIATIAAFDNPSKGYVFCTPRPWLSAPYNPHLMILDNYGTPVFYRQWPRRGNDFKTIVNNQLTFCDFDRNNIAINKYLVMDSKFNIIDSLIMGNGYYVDQHDVIVFENGNHFLMAYDPQLVGMDTVVEGGDPNATVVGFIIQELDADHNVIFQWRSWDHFEITDANHHDFTAATVDYVHGNAFEIDNDGQLLFSCRDMEEITKINLNSGEIIWRFGLHAKNNMFTFTNDTIGFSWQHDIRRIGNGNVTVYDNGNYHDPKFSQAVEYQIDEVNFTATLVWNFIHDPVVFGRATGNNRRLDNDNSFICWGLTWPINYSEVRQDGHVAWELHWPENVWEYRAFRLDWVTDLFETNTDTIDFGKYDDYVPWPRIFTITNNGNEDLTITSVTNHKNSYYVSTPLPITIPSGGTENMTVNFFPIQEEGQIDDILTINCESIYADTLAQLIARQVFLTGYVPDPNPPVASITPEDGSTEVSQTTTIKIAFNESVVNVNGSTINNSDLAGFIEFKETDASGPDVDFEATINVWKTEIEIIPASLKPLQDYFVKLKGNMIADGSGNILTSSTESMFKTADNQGPIVIITPADQSTDVSTLARITFEFDESVVNAEGGEITDEDIIDMVILKENDFEGEDVGFTGTINDDKTKITVIPDTLKILQQYYAELIGGSVSDEYGNALNESQSSTFTTMDDTGIDENILSDQINLFPNPHKGEISLEFKVTGPKDIHVMDAYGKLIFSIEDVYDPIYKIDISDEPNGIYLIRVVLKEQNKSIDFKTLKL